jgi:hypothetical protein
VNLLDVVLLFAGIATGVIVTRLALRALYLHHAVTDIPAVAEPSATDTSERGDLASIPRQNFRR